MLPSHDQPFNFEHSIQYGLMSKFSTGNPLIDPLLHMFIYSLVGILVFNLKSILNFANISYYIWWIVGPPWEYLRKLFHRDPNTFEKQVKIDYITDNRKINNLYKAIDWYLSSKCDMDLTKETPLKMLFEQEIESCTSNAKVSKKIVNNKYKSLRFHDHEILYLLAKDLITVYADKERQRENFSINLSAQVSKDAKTDILEEFCQHCLTEYITHSKPTTWVQKIFVNTRQGEWKSQDSNNRRKLDTVILKEHALDDIRSDVTGFMDSETWYHDRDIPYTRGYLLHGPPGTGKTSLIKAISTHTKRHMHYLMLNNVENDTQLFELLGGINYTQTILIIEDIDCMTKIIESRDATKDNVKDDPEKMTKHELKEKIKKKMGLKEPTKLTLSGLLNAIDGIFNNNGRIMIMTSNHPELLDAALIRPGRIDRKLLFDLCDAYQIKKIFQLMYDTEPSQLQLEKLATIKEHKYSPAEITSLFLKYRNKPETALENLDELDNENFVVNDRKFFGRDIEKLINDTLNKGQCISTSFGGDTFAMCPPQNGPVYSTTGWKSMVNPNDSVMQNTSYKIKN